MESEQSNYSRSESSFFGNKNLKERNIFNIPLNINSIYHFLCKECKDKKDYNNPLIKFNKNLIFITCHENNKEISINDISNIGDYLIKEDKLDNYLEKMKCKEHNESFYYYCQSINCHKNLCKSCYNEHKNLNHSNIVDFVKKNSNLEEKIKSINQVFKLEDYFIYDLDTINNNNLLNLLIITIINDYSKTPNYNLIKNIENIYDFSKNYKIRIYSDIELEDIIKKGIEQLNNIIYIQIYQRDFKKMNLLTDNYESLGNLEELHLIQINMKSLDSLIKCKFLNLKILDLENNSIDDEKENLTIFSMFKDKFPKLEVLNLKKNNLTKYEFFDKIQSLNNLKELNVSANAFTPNCINNNEDKSYIFNNIEKMILSNGVFNNKSIYYIQYFKIKNIKIIDLSSNNLKSLSFLEKVHWPEINTILLNANSIKSIQELSKFKNLKLIEIKDNPIKDIQEAEEIKNQIPDIEIILNIINGNIISDKHKNINEKETEMNSIVDSDDSW